MLGNVMQALGERVFHQLEAVIEVVLQRPRRCFLKGNRASQRFLIGVHC